MLGIINLYNLNYQVISGALLQSNLERKKEGGLKPTLVTDYLLRREKEGMSSPVNAPIRGQCLTRPDPGLCCQTPELSGADDQATSLQAFKPQLHVTLSAAFDQRFFLFIFNPATSPQQQHQWQANA